jgi:1,4-alpha-glucan branching enzyme
MGNEFGHPEWIDFPRQGNNWSYHYARRQWHLADDKNLKYRQLDRFDKAMIALSKKRRLLDDAGTRLLHEHNDDKVLIFERARLVLAFNFHPVRSYGDYRFPASPGRYRIVLNSDDIQFGGHGRVDNGQEHVAACASHTNHGAHRLSIYLPSRTALVLMKRNP